MDKKRKQEKKAGVMSTEKGNVLEKGDGGDGRRRMKRKYSKQ